MGLSSAQMTTNVISFSLKIVRRDKTTLSWRLCFRRFGIEFDPGFDSLERWRLSVSPSLAVNICSYGFGRTSGYLVEHHVHFHGVGHIQRRGRSDELHMIVILGRGHIPPRGSLQDGRFGAKGGRGAGESRLRGLHPVADVFHGDFRRGAAGKKGDLLPGRDIQGHRSDPGMTGKKPE
ncbi:hypothetical protein AVEN_231964-1 [Araneus ventricosus]|uniref:Uncharacterized protein n=1 Tax=Araneus ventricosus TaxID=182803 RepID=A0A4Y2C0F0_ARAVE|nr:hypothetical protein AVEN_231964-1 [Araneus ventricosus]